MDSPVQMSIYFVSGEGWNDLNGEEKVVGQCRGRSDVGGQAYFLTLSPKATHVQVRRASRFIIDIPP